VPQAVVINRAIGAAKEHSATVWHFYPEGRGISKEIGMKKILMATAAMALVSSAAMAQQQNPSEKNTRFEDRATTTAPATPGAGGTNTLQPADPTEASRKGLVNQPTGAGSNAGSAANTTTQPADPEQAQRKGGINQPSSSTTKTQ
jgi:hypothetical protein